MDEKPKNRSVKADGDAIRRLRLAKGWRVEDLARKAKCSVKTVENVEAGEQAYLCTLTNVAAAFGVEFATLVVGAMPPPLKGERFEVLIKLSIPFEEFDQSKQLATFIDLLKRLLGGDDMEPGDVKAGSTIIPVMMTKEQVQKLIETLPDFRARVRTLIEQGALTIEETLHIQRDLIPLVDSITDISIPDDPEFAEHRGQTVSVAK